MVKFHQFYLLVKRRRACEQNGREEQVKVLYGLIF